MLINPMHATLPCSHLVNVLILAEKAVISNKAQSDEQFSHYDTPFFVDC